MLRRILPTLKGPKDSDVLVLELTGSKSRIVHRPLPHDDPKQRQPDIAKAQKILGWKPATPLKEGLGKTIAYFDALLREPGIIDLIKDAEPNQGRRH